MNRHIANALAANSQGPRAWVGVVSRLHVERGVSGGFAQVCHGKQTPLIRMQAGDWFIYYSPSSKMGVPDGLRAFTAIGQVRDRPAYEFDMGDGFVPFRRDIAYRPAKQVALAELSNQLEFTRPGSNWGMLARRGHFQISLADATVIARAMGVREPLVEAQRAS